MAIFRYSLHYIIILINYSVIARPRPQLPLYNNPWMQNPRQLYQQQQQQSTDYYDLQLINLYNLQGAPVSFYDPDQKNCDNVKSVDIVNQEHVEDYLFCIRNAYFGQSMIATTASNDHTTNKLESTTTDRIPTEDPPFVTEEHESPPTTSSTTTTTTEWIDEEEEEEEKEDVEEEKEEEEEEKDEQKEEKEEEEKEEEIVSSITETVTQKDDERPENLNATTESNEEDDDDDDDDDEYRDESTSSRPTEKEITASTEASTIKTNGEDVENVNGKVNNSIDEETYNMNKVEGDIGEVSTTTESEMENGNDAAVAEEVAADREEKTSKSDNAETTTRSFLGWFN